jgi:hypothetical protein
MNRDDNEKGNNDERSGPGDETIGFCQNLGPDVTLGIDFVSPLVGSGGLGGFLAVSHNRLFGSRCWKANLA